MTCLPRLKSVNGVSYVVLPLTSLTQHPKKIARFQRFIDKTPGQGPNGDCWEYHGTRNKNYGVLSFGYRNWFAHRVAYFLETGIDLPPDVLLRHHCDNPPCCRPSHCEPGTQLDNVRDCHERGRWRPGVLPVGIAHHGHKLTEAGVRLIRRSPQQTVAALARQLGVGWTAVDRVRKGTAWRHVA